jgi:hypothetical protein
VLDEHATRDVRLHGLDRVTGLAPGQVLRTEPLPDSVEVETTLFPYVELAAPDLPWLFTPASDGNRGLRPWLVLVVVREQEGVRLDTPAGSLPLLSIELPAVAADELPDLAESWAWAHVQSLVGLDGSAAAVATGTGEVVARLLGPRRLLPDSSWLACVVPAFDGGVLAGRGDDVPDGASWLPAWDFFAGRDPGALPVYYYWRFSTAREGNFETLCRRLVPDENGAPFGLQPMDVSDPGLMDPSAAPVLLDFEGALCTHGVVPRPWKKKDKAAFQSAATKLLDAAIQRADVQPPGAGAAYDPATQDPVVGPPLYGQWPSGAVEVPKAGWVCDVNLDPVARAVAGLGAEVVRAAQEELVAAAWDQAGSARASVAALNQGRLAVEVGRRLRGRLTALGDGDVLHLTAPLHALLGSGGKSIRVRLAAGPVPSGLVTTAHLRLTRPGTPLARDWEALSGPLARLGADHVHATVSATMGKSSPALTFASYGPLNGAQQSDPTLDESPPALPAHFPSVGPPGKPGGAHVDAPEAPPAGHDVSGIAADVISALDPVEAVRAGLLARLPALEPLLPGDTIPTTVALAPSFDDGLSDDLVRLGAEYLLPAADGLGNNRVRMVESNPAFAAEFLIGANHGLACELLWRGYPVDLRATFFQRFWRYSDPTQVDIDPLAGWTSSDSLDESLPEGTQPMTVFVVRGDVVRRYPTAHYFLQKSRLARGGTIRPVDGQVAAAVVRGMLDRDTLFVGFEKGRDEVVGDRADGGDPGWLLAIEEQPAAPRFGLDDPPDPADYNAPPTTWNDLSWANVVADESALAALTYAPADVAWPAGTSIDGTTWGGNAAHMARACYQAPFCIYFPADRVE